MGKEISTAAKQGLLILIAALASCTTLDGECVTPEIWRVSTYEDFASGEGERVSLENPGRVRLAPSHRVYTEVGESAVWSLVESPDGKAVYLGTGSKAEIYKIAVEPKSATGKAELFASLEGSTVQALILGKDGSLYAGVSPDGKVYRISTAGAVTLVGATQQKYIWAMEFDASGNLILATGDAGKIIRMDPQGKTEDLADLEEKHILSLRGNGKGSFYFGTSPGGWIGILDGKKDLRILHDSEKDETKALVLDEEGNLFAGVAPTVKVEPPRDAPAPAGAGGRPSGGNELSSDLIRISPDGNPTRVATTDNAAINCLHVWNGRVVLGTGDAGKLFGLGEYNRLDLILDLEPKEVLAIANRKEGGVWIATGNPAQILVLPLGANEGGKYAAKPLDAGASAQWGMMTWTASIPEGATLDFQTRSGNTGEPDDTWSDWSDPILEAGVVPSPAARYLQWRARFGGADKAVTAQVHEVEVVYQKFNQSPIIESVDLGGGSGASATSKSSNGGGSSSGSSSGSTSGGSGSGSAGKSAATPGASSSLQIEWKVSDPNGDDLIHRLDYRQIGENLWKEIEKDLKTPKHTWSLVGVPDGDYEIRVQSSDEIANPLGVALSDEWITEKIRKDSTAPEVVEWKDQKPSSGAFLVKVVVRDALSRLVHVEVMVDGKEDKARPLLPADGVLDEREEEFEIQVDGLASGEHSLTLRARDEVGNTGSGALTFQIP